MKEQRQIDHKRQGQSMIRTIMTKTSQNIEVQQKLENGVNDEKFLRKMSHFRKANRSAYFMRWMFSTTSMKVLALDKLLKSKKF